MEDVIGAIVNKVLALRTKRTRCIWNRVLIVVFSSTTSCTWRGLTVEFFSFLAMAALGNWVGVKHGRSGVIEQVSSCRARNTKGSSVVVLMLCFTGRANAAIAGSIRRLCTFDAEEALVEVGVESGRSGIIEQVSSGWARNTKGSSVVVLMLCFTGWTNAAIACSVRWLCTFDAEEALLEVGVKSGRTGVIEQVSTLRTRVARDVWKRVLVLVRSSMTNCTWRGLTGEFVSFVAMEALGNWIGVKEGRSGVVE